MIKTRKLRLVGEESSVVVVAARAAAGPSMSGSEEWVQIP